MSSGAQILARGATEQASSIEELSGTISVISDQVGENARAPGGQQKSGKCNVADEREQPLYEGYAGSYVRDQRRFQ